MEERMQMEQEVTLEQMLEARERRVQRQRTLLDRYGQSLICGWTGEKQSAHPPWLFLG